MSTGGDGFTAPRGRGGGGVGDEAGNGFGAFGSSEFARSNSFLLIHMDRIAEGITMGDELKKTN